MNRQRPLILIVDQELAIRALLGDLLRNSFECLQAGTDHEARRLFRQHAPRIAAVVADAELRCPDGVALTSWILAQPENVPLLLMTNGDSPGSAAARDLWRFADIRWLEKPFSIAEVWLLLDRLTARKMQEELFAQV